MQYALTILALGATTALAASDSPIQVPDTANNAGSPPPGCQTSYSGTFNYGTIQTSSKKARSLDDVLGKRAAPPACDSTVSTLNDGIFLNSEGSQAYIASNYQFQHDGPPQAGTIVATPWSICPNGTLAIGGNAVFSQCDSGPFFNLYDFDTPTPGKVLGPQCSDIFFEIASCTTTQGQKITTTAVSFTSAAGESTDGQVSPSSAAASSTSATSPAAVSSVPTTAAVSSATGSPAAVSPAVVATPFPAGNSSSNATPVTGSAPGATTAPAAAPSPSSFKGAADTLIVGQTFVGLVAAAGAYFLL